MLNKTKSNILPMLDTLGDALGQYFTDSTNELLEGIMEFVDVITAHVGVESMDVFMLSEALKGSMRSQEYDEIENHYIEFCETIASLPVQYKVVFLPYYDNTWDSLASVYEAFAADPLFVTEIVIIPINRNTPIGFEHVYNDYLTPQGIPNTHYDNYSFEVDQPDIVFYNQPYDGVNYPKFQSKNIRPHVGLMVYVPYAIYRHEYIPPDRMSEYNQREGELPGHDNADIIVAQGNSFYNQFSTTTRNGHKMVDLGNPKTDSIWNNTMKDEWMRYPEWESVLNGKKVFLLNTHYSSFFNTPVPLNATASTSSWLTYLLNHIANDDDLVLIWRPHPQMYMMLESMVGDGKILFDDSMSIAESCNRIIIDRTPSVVSAFMYCDAIISEHSSIISEAICLNKPVFLVGVDYREYRPDTSDYYKPEYQAILSQATAINPNELLLHSAIPTCGISAPLIEGESLDEMMYRKPIFDFINHVKNNIDPKADSRHEYRRQLLSNLDGKCGSAIHTYVKNMLTT